MPSDNADTRLLALTVPLDARGTSSRPGFFLELEAELDPERPEAPGTLLAARVGPLFGWDPRQDVLFRGGVGRIDLSNVGSRSPRLHAELDGFRHPPVTPEAEREGGGDFFQVRPQAMHLSLTLDLRPFASDGAEPSVKGTVTLSSPTGSSPMAAIELTADIASGTIRAFPGSLGAMGFTKKKVDYYLELAPLLLARSSNTTFKSVGPYMAAVRRLWEKGAGVRIAEKHPQTLTSRRIHDALAEGRIGPLIEYVESHRPFGGVPVVIVKPEFRPGGALTTEHGWEKAIVIVRDGCVGKNATLLAHEIGHVLCGNDAKKKGKSTSKYWTGEPDHLMDAKDSCADEPPNSLCQTSKKRARFFAQKP